MTFLCDGVSSAVEPISFPSCEEGPRAGRVAGPERDHSFNE